MNPYEQAKQAATAVRRELDVPRIEIALVLGSGWSSGAERLGETIGEVPLASLPGFHAPAVSGHGGAIQVVRTRTGKIAAVLTGRTHLYEGRGVDAVVHGVRTMAACGALSLVLTNGCGGLDPERGPGTVVMISDHLNLTGRTPLVGPTFIDMSTTYTPRLRDLARQVDSSLSDGVYAQFHGPQYETPAEVRMARTLGADLVGMSTALEAIAAREAGMEVLGLSLVTNLAAGISPTPLDHGEVLEAGRNAAPRLAALLGELVDVL